MDQSIRFCTSSDGVKLAYAVTGDGPPLVMSATWLTHLEHQWRSLAWKPWLEALSRDHRLLRYDSRGCGLSDRDIDNLSFETWVKDFEKVIDAAGFGRFSLVSTCWGGPVAIEYAARHPERVDRLVLYGTYARGRLRRSDQPKEVEKARVLLDLTRLGWGQENHAFLQVWANHFQPGGSIEHVRSWCDQQRAATSAEMAVRLLGIGWSVDGSEAARNIKCPVLVMHPERDAVVPIDEGRLLASLIPDARFVTLDSENHMPLAEEPAWAQLVAEMRAFLMAPVAASANNASAARPAHGARARGARRHRQRARQLRDRGRAEIVREDRAQPHHPHFRQDRRRAPLPGDCAGARSRPRHARRLLEPGQLSLIFS